MSHNIVEEGTFLLYCFLSGILITMAYDLLRIFRRVIRHGIWWTSMEDLLFWIASAVFLFIVFYKTNDGIIRWYSVAGAGVGMLTYKYSIGEHIVEIMSMSLNKILDIVSGVLKGICRPINRLFHRVFGKIRKGIKKSKKVLKKKLTGNIKNIKITLCKHTKMTNTMVKQRGSHETKIEKKGRFSR